MGLHIYCYSCYSNSASFNCTVLIRTPNNLNHVKCQKRINSLTICNTGKHLRVWAGEETDEVSDEPSGHVSCRRTFPLQTLRKLSWGRVSFLLRR